MPRGHQISFEDVFQYVNILRSTKEALTAEILCMETYSDMELGGQFYFEIECPWCLTLNKENFRYNNFFSENEKKKAKILPDRAQNFTAFK